MSVPEILSHVTSLLQSLGLSSYLQAFLIISIAISLLYKIFDRGG